MISDRLSQKWRTIKITVISRNPGSFTIVLLDHSESYFVWITLLLLLIPVQFVLGRRRRGLFYTNVILVYLFDFKEDFMYRVYVIHVQTINHQYLLWGFSRECEFVVVVSSVIQIIIQTHKSNTNFLLHL